MTNTSEIGTTSGIGRRQAIRTIAAVGLGTLAAPAIVRQARSSSGELNFLGWTGYDYGLAFADFTKTTGIDVHFTGRTDQDRFLADSKAAKGLYDVCEPTTDNLSTWVAQDLIRPWNESNIDIDNVMPWLRKGDAGAMQLNGGNRYSAPSCWGTEAIAYNTRDAPQTYGECSLSVLWDPKYEGKVTVRSFSGLAALGRWLDLQGKLPHPFLDSFKDEAVMRANWDVILANAMQFRKDIGRFWKNESTAQGAFLDDGCVLGLTWDTSAFRLSRNGMPVGYVSPKEGAFAWMQGIVLLKDAKNVEQAEAFVRWLNSRKGAALWATTFTATPCAKGSVDLLPLAARDQYHSAFPADALSRLWWWPPEPSWYLTLRNEYARRFQAS